MLTQSKAGEVEAVKLQYWQKAKMMKSQFLLHDVQFDKKIHPDESMQSAS